MIIYVLYCLATVKIFVVQNEDKKVARITEFTIDICDWPVKELLQPVVERYSDS